MLSTRTLLRAASLLLLFAASAFPAMARAQSTERDAILFVQTHPLKNGGEGIHLVWIPQPLQRVCLGKTAEQCADIDYCVRTTNRDVKTCHDLGIPLSRLPSYPPGMVPRRQLS